MNTYIKNLCIKAVVCLFTALLPYLGNAQFSTGSKPDLTAYISGRTTLINANAGSTVNVAVTVKNQGNASSNASYLKYYLGTQPQKSITDIYLGSDYVVPLNIYATSGESATLTIPANTTTGTYYILYLADANAQVSESNENNNLAYQQINVTGAAVQYPDLIVTNQGVNVTTIEAGSSLNFYARVKNNGPVSSGTYSYLKYYLSSNTTYNSGDVYYGSDYVGTLNSGSTSYETASKTIASSTTAGTYYILFMADANDYVNESNENNNLAYSQIQILASQAPTAPGILTASNITATSATLNWNAASDNMGVTGYNIYKNGSLVTSTTATTYNTGGLSPGSTYDYTIKAKDQAGNLSNASNTISVTTVLSQPSAPTFEILCEGTLATISLPADALSSLDYFWQSSATGTSTENNQTNFNTSQSGVYYLRARTKNAPYLWSTASQTSNVILSQTPVDQAQNTPLNNAVTDITLGQNQPAGTTLPDVTPHYVKSYNLTEKITEASQITESLNKEQALVAVQYSDAMGRSLQTILKESSPQDENGTSFDVVMPVAYDAFGRTEKNYLGYVSNESGNSNFRKDAINEQYNFYNNSSDNIADSNYPYTKSVFEKSPSSPVTDQYFVGEHWTGNGYEGEKVGVHFSERNNTTTEVLSFDFVNNKPVLNGTYQAGKLIASVVVSDIKLADDGSNTIQSHMGVSFTNKKGQVVAKFIQSGGSQSSPVFSKTYYVYDNHERLRYVLPPLAIEQISAAGQVTDDILNQYTFSYQYDQEHRLISKKVVGKGDGNGIGGEVHIVYDILDRAVLTQHANQRVNNQWSFVKYDQLGRPALIGTITDNRDRAALQEEADNKNTTTYLAYEKRGGNIQGYTNQAFPAITANDILNVSYYDNYNFEGAKSYTEAYNNKIYQAGSAPKPFYRIRGLATASKVKIPDTGQWLLTQIFYDKRGRAIQIHADNHTGGTDIQLASYDFSGKILKTYSLHNGYEQFSSVKSYTYDHIGRLLSIGQNINDNAQSQTVASYQYNKMGQLISKTLGDQIQQLDFKYNFAGQLTDINDINQTLNSGNNTDLFAMHFDYETGFEKTRYDGKISGIKWKSATDNKTRAYGYSYDGLGRLTRADYVAKSSSNQWNDEKDQFTVFGISYDANGNIQTLNREGMLTDDNNGNKTFGAMDRLNYSYQGNSLKTVDDYVITQALAQDFNDTANKSCITGNNEEYTYDLNGNLTSDANKNITSIQYNDLDLPEVITFGAPSENKKIKYLYDGSGSKLRKEVYDGDATTPIKKTDYVAGVVYENQVLQFMHTEEGRLLSPVAQGRAENSSTGAAFAFEYHIKDHQGNTRVTMEATNTQVYSSTSDSDKIGGEEKEFANANENRITGFSRINGSNSADDGAVRLPAFNGEVQYGPQLFFRVHKGDVIDTKIYAAYFENQAPPNFTMVEGSAGGGNISEGGFNGIVSGVAAGNNPNGSNIPKSYISIIFIPDGGAASVEGLTFIDGSAKNNTGFAEINSPGMQIDGDQDGYVLVYAANESNTEVFFDDFEVTHTKASRVTQENHYYPGGMNIAGIETYTEDRTNFYQYNQSTEKETAHGLNWYETPFRSFDAQLLRFHQVDALAESYHTMTPYHYASNDPVNGNDPTGLYTNWGQVFEDISFLMNSDHGGTADGDGNVTLFHSQGDTSDGIASGTSFERHTYTKRGKHKVHRDGNSYKVKNRNTTTHTKWREKTGIIVSGFPDDIASFDKFIALMREASPTFNDVYEELDGDEENSHAIFLVPAKSKSEKYLEYYNDVNRAYDNGEMSDFENTSLVWFSDDPLVISDSKIRALNGHGYDGKEEDGTGTGSQMYFYWERRFKYASFYPRPDPKKVPRGYHLFGSIAHEFHHMWSIKHGLTSGGASDPDMKVENPAVTFQNQVTKEINRYFKSIFWPFQYPMRKEY